MALRQHWRAQLGFTGPAHEVIAAVPSRFHPLSSLIQRQLPTNGPFRPLGDGRDGCGTDGALFAVVIADRAGDLEIVRNSPMGLDGTVGILDLLTLLADWGWGA